jgi:hypothetical protein
MTRPREFLDRRRIRRGISDADLQRFRPRRLDPPSPVGLTSGAAGVELGGRLDAETVEELRRVGAAITAERHAARVPGPFDEEPT